MTVLALVEAPSRITVTATPLIVGRSQNAQVRLFHPTVSGQHARLARQSESLVLEDLDSTYGTFVNGDRVKKVVLRTNDRVTFGPRVSYRVNGQGLELDAAACGLRLVGQDVAILRDGRLLVKNADFDIPADSFTGILGPSGIGKSTLLNCLATFLSPGHGRIVFDDQRDFEQHRDELRAMLGHVPQDDIVLKALTVTENLAYAARLRLEERNADETSIEVTRVLSDVGLTPQADQPARKLSGGELKRLSVAIELLKRPRLLLLDEPTSGLDPATESHLMAQMKRLAKRGTTVVCTTHLMENIELFDVVIVFGKREDCGQIAYVGSPRELLSRFCCKSYADVYEQLERGQFEPHSVGVAGTADLVSPPIDSSPIASSTAPSLKQWVAELGIESSAVRQLGLLTERAFRVLARDRSLLLTIVGQPLGLGLLNVLSQYAALHTDALHFFSVVIATWLGLNNSARDLVRERRLYVRERLAGLRRGVFLMSKMLFHTVLGAGQLLLLLSVLAMFRFTAQEALVQELRDTSFVWLFCVLLSVYVGALGLGLLISEIVQTEEAAVALLPLLIMPQLLISAVGTGQSEMVFHSSRGHMPFRSVVEAVQNLHTLEPTARLAELASLICYTRPAILLIQPPSSMSNRRHVLFADGIHLFLLVISTWTATIVGFQWAEERWGRLIGIG